MLNTNISTMKSLNSGAGQKFFNKETMKGWGTKIEVYPKKNFFITSENNFSNERVFTIRFFNLKNYKVYTVNFKEAVNSFGSFIDLEKAEKCFKRIVNTFHLDNFKESEINFIFDNLTDIRFTESDEIKLTVNHKKEYIIA